MISHRPSSTDHIPRPAPPPAPAAPTPAPGIEYTTKPTNTAESPRRAPTPSTCGLKRPPSSVGSCETFDADFDLSRGLWRGCLDAELGVEVWAWREERVREVEKWTNPICFNLHVSLGLCSGAWDKNSSPLDVELVNGSLQVVLLSGRYAIQRESDCRGQLIAYRWLRSRYLSLTYR
jgi:hypothetical protein